MAERVWLYHFRRKLFLSDHNKFLGNARFCGTLGIASFGVRIWNNIDKNVQFSM
jgi:hypothetical protein